jgi:hypothetical protein
MKPALIASVSIFALGCAGEVSDDDVGLDGQQESVVATVNGLRTVNGLTTVNGLKTANGLKTTNGLKTVNGLTTVNGLKTANGLKTVNGLSVDCTGMTAGVNCTGAPDGLLSASTGLMSSENGVTTAKYLVRCALAANDSVTVKDYNGNLVTMPGELGLTTGWATGQCDETCQQKITSCLLAFTNGSGVHVPIEMSSNYVNADGVSGTADDKVLTIGAGHSIDYPKQEAAFYGNVFTDPPQAYYCTNDGPLSFIPGIGNLLTVDVRACGGYVDILGLGLSFQNSCPIKSMGSCSEIVATLQTLMIPHLKCSEKDGAKTKCESGAGTGMFGTVLSVFNNKTWQYPMTTYVKAGAI